MTLYVMHVLFNCVNYIYHCVAGLLCACSLLVIVIVSGIVIDDAAVRR
jgi:hypothetical protein